MNRIIDRGEFWNNKYYRLPRRLLFEPSFWSRSNESLAILPLFGIKCSAIPNRSTCYVGYRQISKLCGIEKNIIPEALSGLTNHYFPLVNIVDVNRGSRPIRYGLNQNAIAIWNHDTYFPFYGYILRTGIWAQLSHNAKNLYMIIGGVSFQDPIAKEPSSLDKPHNRISSFIDIESVVDILESCSVINGEDINFLELDSIYDELESFDLIVREDNFVRISLLYDENIKSR